jgi:hypothetical protein
MICSRPDFHWYFWHPDILAHPNRVDLYQFCILLSSQLVESNVFEVLVLQRHHDALIIFEDLSQFPKAETPNY